MSVELESLDDIIKKSKFRNPVRGRGGRRGGTRGGSTRVGTVSRSSDRVKPGVSRGRGGTIRGVVRTNGTLRGGRKVIEDARLKIIQKNRQKVKDAREKLAHVAKQTDARVKLRSRTFNPRDVPATLSRRPIRNGRVGLSTHKMAPLSLRPLVAAPILQPSIRNSSYRDPIPNSRYVSDLMLTNYNDGYMMPQAPMRRTISNEYSIPPAPPAPLFSAKPSYVDWDKPVTEHVPPPPPISRPQPSRSSEHMRQREYKVLPRSSLREVKSESHPYRDEYYPSKSSSSNSRTVLAETSDKYYSSSRSQSTRSRAVSPKVSRPTSSSTSSSRSKLPSSSSSSSTNSSSGYRIVVSNLQPNVTQEDIKELFEDVGELLVSRLVRPGIAEVVYKTLSDATKAVETYHNRQLDGHPMKCLLVNKSKTSSSSSSSRGVLQHARGSNYSSRPPSMGTVHRALFD